VFAEYSIGNLTSPLPPKRQKKEEAKEDFHFDPSEAQWRDLLLYRGCWEQKSKASTSTLRGSLQ